MEVFRLLLRLREVKILEWVIRVTVKILFLLLILVSNLIIFEISKNNNS